MYLTTRTVGARTEYSLRHDLLSSRRVKREGRRHVRIILGQFPLLTRDLIDQVEGEYPNLDIDWASLIEQCRRIVVQRWPHCADWLLSKMADPDCVHRI
jgi:hypothetical protein